LLAVTETPTPYARGLRPTVVLAGLGLAGSVGLQVLHFRAYTSPASTGFCAVAAKVDCNAVALSPWSVILGVPVALWGVVFFFFVGLALITRSPFALPMVLLGAAGSLGLALVEVFAVGSVCLFCEAVHVISWVMAALVYRERALYRERTLDRWDRVATLAYPLVALVGIGLVISPYWKRVSWRGNPSLPTGVTEDGYHFIGAEHPRVELHEYVDYFCPHCRIMSRWTEKQLIMHPRELRIIRHFHPGSTCPSYKLRQCLYVAAAVCAAEQGKFWQMDRWLLENASQRRRLDPAAGARAIGANAALLRVCLDRPETLEQVRRLAREASAKKFAGTPGYVLDGQRVAPRDLEARLKQRL
jgi:uncharacterized membrane protein